MAYPVAHPITFPVAHAISGGDLLGRAQQPPPGETFATFTDSSGNEQFITVTDSNGVEQRITIYTGQ